MKMLGTHICNRYVKQDSQLVRGNRKTFFTGGEALIISQFKVDLLMWEEGLN